MSNPYYGGGHPHPNYAGFGAGAAGQGAGQGAPVGAAAPRGNQIPAGAPGYYYGGHPAFGQQMGGDQGTAFDGHHDPSQWVQRENRDVGYDLAQQQRYMQQQQRQGLQPGMYGAQTASPGMSAQGTPGPRRRGRPAGSGRRGRKSLMSRPGRHDDLDDEDEEDDFTMEGMKTKSGRKVHRPSQFNPAVKTPTRRRGAGRRVVDVHFCSVCLRGHSPGSNRIVFCDGCNTAYHQLCHDPPIDDIVINVEDAAWYCENCEKKRIKPPMTTGASGQDLGISQDERKAYLVNLPQSQLVELLLFCETKQPNLPFYPPDIREKLAEMKKAKDDAIAADQAAAARAFSNGNDEDFEEPAPEYDASYAIEHGIEVPSHEEIIARAIQSLGPCSPKDIFDWMEEQHAWTDEFRGSASEALQKGVQKNRFIRNGQTISLNPGYETSRKRKFVVPDLPQGAGIKVPSEDEDDLMGDDDNDEGISHHVA